MTKLKVIATSIECKDPQDPRKDEIYFITTISGKSKSSQTLRKMSAGSVRENLVLFDSEFDTNRNSPIIITLTEERALRDDGDFANAMEKLADQAIELGKKKLATSPVNTVIASIGGWLLDNVISLAKHVFRDQVLAAKVIPLPYNPENPGKTYNYKIHAKNNKFPTYEYNVNLQILFE